MIQSKGYEEALNERENDYDHTEENTDTACVYAQLSQNNHICEGYAAPVLAYCF